MKPFERNFMSSPESLVSRLKGLEDSLISMLQWLVACVCDRPVLEASDSRGHPGAAFDIYSEWVGHLGSELCVLWRVGQR